MPKFSRRISGATGSGVLPPAPYDFRFVDFVVFVLEDGGQAGGPFSRGAFRVEGQEAGQDLVLEFCRPVEPGFGRLTLVGILFDELGRGTVSEVVPAIGAQHGSIHFGMERPQAGDIGGILARA